MCYAGVPVKANRSAHGIAAACTLRNWLGMWSLRHAQTRAEPHLARIDCPALVINAEQDTGVYPIRRPAHLRRAGQHRQDAVLDRHRPLLHHPGRPQREGRYDRQVDREAVALRVLAHFVPGEKVTGIPCARGGLARYPVLRRRRRRHLLPRTARGRGDLARAAADLRRRPRAGADSCRLVHKLGAGVNTIDVETATRLGIAVANMPGPTDTRRQSAARPGQRGADPARHLVGRSVARRYDGHH